MPKKGMRTIFFSSSTSSPTTPEQVTPRRHTFSETLMNENFETAHVIISKWDSSNSSDCSPNPNVDTSLFVGNRHEAKEYLNSIKQLQSAMQYYISENPNSEKLARAQTLMQIAMKRLEKEFYLILKSNRDYLDAESVSSHSSRPSTVSRSSFSDFEDDSEDDSSRGGNSVARVLLSVAAVDDLKAIADCMIASGYARECVKIYKIIRKSIVDEALYRLGVEKMKFSHVVKMDWEVLELKINSWLNAVKVAVKTLFYGERILCDHVFSASLSIRASCFAEIVKDEALTLFEFPEIVAKCKKTPEKMFRTLDLYEAIADLWTEIESIFDFESTSAVRSLAANSLVKIGEAVRAMLTEFETAISKDGSKAAVPGGGVHPLTRYVMNYLAFLSDYSGILADIVADWPLQTASSSNSSSSSPSSPLPESYLEENDGVSSSPASVRIAWIILVLLCKLDRKAEAYNDVALSYLFLANNLRYVVNKVRTSSLKLLLGGDWSTKHDAKARQYAANYERVCWSKVIDPLPEDYPAEAKIALHDAADRFRRFNAAFEEAYRRQASWVVADAKLREEIKLSVARNLVPRYRVFYETYRDVIRREMGNVGTVRFAPDDLGNYLSDLLHGRTGGSGSVSSYSATSSFSSSSGHSRGRQ